MYKFTNGIVVFDEATRDAYLKSGMVLVKESEKVEDNKKEEKVENKTNDKNRTIRGRGNRKISK